MSQEPVTIDMSGAFAAYLEGTSAVQGDDSSTVGKRVFEAFENSIVHKRGVGTVVRVRLATDDVAEWIQDQAETVRDLAGGRTDFTRAEIQGAKKALERVAEARKKLSAVEDTREDVPEPQKPTQPRKTTTPAQPRARGLILQHEDCPKCIVLARQAREKAGWGWAEVTFETASHAGTWKD